MLESILLNNSGDVSLNMQTMVLCSLASIALGLVISFVYMLCNKKYSKSFVVSLAVLPILVQAVIMMVNGNLGTGVAIVGAFSLVRFRSLPGSSKEIVAVFFAMAIGLATGMGYIGFAFLITIIVAAVLLILSRTPYGEKEELDLQLRVTIPENLNYVGLFDDIFEKYLIEYKTDKVKTTNLGSLFEVTYSIKMKDPAFEKNMIDEIRVRNGNLTVVCGKITKDGEEL